MKTDDLKGRALDYAVAKATGYEDGWLIKNPKSIPFFSKSPDLCGELIERFNLKVEPIGLSGWQVSVRLERAGWNANYELYHGDTLSIAVCLAVAGCNFGDEIQIPESIQESQQ